jgi:hypothetical protein
MRSSLPSIDAWSRARSIAFRKAGANGRGDAVAYHGRLTLEVDCERRESNQASALSRHAEELGKSP